MKFDDGMIKRYAGKIYGFAYQKTGRTHDAEDLSQEILLNLCRAEPYEKSSLDSFVYTVCRYTWSNFLKKNKRAWDSVTIDGDISLYIDSSYQSGDLSDDIVHSETIERLRREIMYLSKIRREIIILRYYEGLNSDEISVRLDIPSSTVRWHLSKIRHDLKERLDMDEKIYSPVSLAVGHYGWHKNEVYAALETDILMQNICVVCSSAAKSIEEISRTLGVAAVYLEDKITRLLSMDYMVENNGKYQTNFLIMLPEYTAAEYNFKSEHVGFVAERYYNAVKPWLPAIREVGFIGSDIPETDLLWDMLAYFMMTEIGVMDNRMIAELNLKHGAPLRPDGSRHWVRARVRSDKIRELMTPVAASLFDATIQRALKSSSNFDGTVQSYQYDIPGLFGDFRTFDSYSVTGIIKAADYERRGAMIDDLDREPLAILANNGYIKISSGLCHLEVPYLLSSERQKVDNILSEAARTIPDREKIYELFIEYAKYIDRYIPSHISKNERAHHITSFDPHAEALWYLNKSGILPLSDNLGAACTIVFEK